MRPLLAAILCLACLGGSRAAFLRTIYLDTNGRDIRMEVLVDKWWAAEAQETASVPAGTMIKYRSSPTTLVDSNWTVPVDIALQLRNPSPNVTARLGAQGRGDVRLCRHP